PVIVVSANTDANNSIKENAPVSAAVETAAPADVTPVESETKNPAVPENTSADPVPVENSIDSVTITDGKSPTSQNPDSTGTSENAVTGTPDSGNPSETPQDAGVTPASTSDELLTDVPTAEDTTGDMAALSAEEDPAALPANETADPNAVQNVLDAVVTDPTQVIDGADGAEDMSTQAVDAGETQDPATLPEGLPQEPVVTAVDYTPMVLVPEVNSSEVIKLQQRLMDLNYMDDDEPTEYYGGVTQQAVKYFQRKHDLPVDGVAGLETQQLLFSDQAQVYTVSLEAEGPDVEGIQDRLIDLGYPASSTGYFGEETESAVKYFQRMNGLADDGSVGEYTLELLYSEEAIPAEKPKPTPAKSGSSGSSSGSKGGGGGGSSSSHVANPGSVESMISVAMAQVGKPYVRGGKGPDSFDCSGLVYYALSASGNGIGYMTSGGWAGSSYAYIGSLGELQRGDIICFSGHVGIYLGDGMMVDASSSKGQVVVRNCTGSWSVNNFICGRRPL
ncbi:MAG: peptidoglycan-binding protein, partial [Christensenellaceae bacterium]